MKPQRSIQILYDGNCPICLRKKRFLEQRDKQRTLQFSDIRSAEFNPDIIDASTEQLAAEIHAILPDGTLISGMAVIRAAYRCIGLGWLIAPTGWPVLRPLFDLFYRFVASHRLQISRWLGASQRK